MMDLIISENGYRMLKEYTDELVFYNEYLDIYIWAIDHWGHPGITSALIQKSLSTLISEKGKCYEKNYRYI